MQVFAHKEMRGGSRFLHRTLLQIKAENCICFPSLRRFSLLLNICLTQLATPDCWCEKQLFASRKHPGMSGDFRDVGECVDQHGVESVNKTIKSATIAAWHRGWNSESVHSFGQLWKISTSNGRIAINFSRHLQLLKGNLLSLCCHEQSQLMDKPL